MHELVSRFKALGDETRFKIFLLLSEHNVCVKGLAEILHISESAVSQHLKVLRNAGLVKGEKIGYFVHYMVQRDVLGEIEAIIGGLAEGTADMQELKKSLDIDIAVCTKVCQRESGFCGGE